jgi:hypothetical protein
MPRITTAQARSGRSHRFSHLCAFLVTFVLASSLFAGEGTVRKHPNAVRNEYIVVLNPDFPAANVRATANAISNQHSGTLRKVWTHAVKGFFIEMTAARAEAMSHDPRIKYVEENSRLQISGVQNTTTDPQQPYDGLDYTPGEDILWHLDRIDQQNLPLDNQYHYCSTGNGVTVYVVDSGVKRTHNEFISANVRDGFDASVGGWVANKQYSIGDQIRDTINRNTWICVLAPNGFRGASGAESQKPNFSGGIGTIVTDNELSWQNYGVSDPAYDPCQGGGDWPVLASPDPSKPRNHDAYRSEVFLSGHGTSVASLVAGQQVGVARGAIIVPVKVRRCDQYEARELVARPYQYGERIISFDGHLWICSTAGTSTTSTTSNTSVWLSIGGTVVHDPDPSSTLAFTNIGTWHLDDSIDSTIQMAIDGIDWILDPARNPNPVDHTIATFSTFRTVGESMLTGSGSFEEAVQNLILRGVTVFASANNQDRDACLTSPARLSRDNTDNTLGLKKVITVGGTMPSNANGVEGRWVCSGTPCVNEEPGSNTGMCVTLFAPARNIRSAQMSGPTDYRRRVAVNGLEPVASGTSFSAPMAAGVGAQFLQWYPNGEPDDVYNAIINSSAKGVLDPTTLQGTTNTPTPNRVLRTTDVWIYSSPNPTPQTVPYGTQVSLAVSAVGGGALSYQWYAGAAGDTSTPVGTNTATLNITPTATQTYWCRVSTISCNGNATLDSPLYGVTVVCTPATIVSQPVSNPSTIAPGASSTLSIGVTGSLPTVQWYTDSNTPVGTGTSLSVSPSSTTTYYAIVSNACTSAITSHTATVIVCAPATVLSGPTRDPHTINPGGSSTLSIAVAGSTPISVSWYTDAGGFVGSGTSISVSPTTDTTYHAILSNPCASGVQSGNAQVTICNGAPIVTQNPTVNQTPITSGQSATLQAGGGTGATPLTYEWFTYNGTQIGTGKKLVVWPTMTTTYYYRIRNVCGESAPSLTVTVTVN